MMIKNIIENPRSIMNDYIFEFEISGFKILWYYTVLLSVLQSPELENNFSDWWFLNE